MTASLIVVLVLILVIIVIISVAVLVIRKKVREFSRQVFHTDSLREGFQNVEEEYVRTPKSVSAMTSVCLPRITRDFPEFNYEEMKHRAENVLTSYLSAISSDNASLLREGSQELVNRLEDEIAFYKNKDQRMHYDSIALHRTEISSYVKRSGRCVVTFETSVQYYRYVTDSTGQIVSGTKDRLFQSKYQIELVYVQDVSLLKEGSAIGVNCPNCGAPITNLGAKFCQYCGTGIIEVNYHSWTFDNVIEDNNSK